MITGVLVLVAYAMGVGHTLLILRILNRKNDND
jgi:cytochrome c biogenesis protein CcdA